MVLCVCCNGRGARRRQPYTITKRAKRQAATKPNTLPITMTAVVYLKGSDSLHSSFQLHSSPGPPQSLSEEHGSPIQFRLHTFKSTLLLCLQQYSEAAQSVF